MSNKCFDYINNCPVQSHWVYVPGNSLKIPTGKPVALRRYHYLQLELKP